MKNKKANLIVLVLSTIFFMLFAFIDGPILCDDTNSYIQLTTMREPLYPLFLLLFRTIFKSSSIYLNTVVIVQSLLMAYAVYYVSTKIVEISQSNDVIKVVVFLIFIFVSILSRFASKRSNLYSNCILSEAIAYPLFLIFIVLLFKYFVTNDSKALIKSCVLSFLLISTRKQMYLTLILIVCVFIFQMIEKKDFTKYAVRLILVVILVFTSCKLFDYVYTKSINNINTTHTSDNRFLTTMVIYCSDTDNINLIDNIEVNKLYKEIVKECDNNHLLKKYEEGTWYEKSLHFSNSYDKIQQTIWDVERKYIDNNYKMTIAEREVLVDKYNKVINESTITNIVYPLLQTIISSFLFGLIITISSASPKFVLISSIFYLIYVVLLLINIKNNKFDAYSKFGILVLLSIIINTGIVSVVIFVQTRYTIYNMGLFYTSLVLLVYNKIIRKKGERNEK